MENLRPEYFGAEPQQALQQRAEDLWHIVRDDRRFSCHGRAVALANYTEENLPVHLALARLQGVGPLGDIEKNLAQKRRKQLEAEGLVADEYVNWKGGIEAIETARAIMNGRKFPSDLRVVEVDEYTSLEDLRKLDSLTQQCDVLLPMGSFLRGQQMPSVFLFAVDKKGKVVGSSAAVAQYHPEHSKADTVWWGMLATDKDRRGEGIALILGAMALDRINTKFGYSSCFTGIREGNKPSEALCAKMGLEATSTIDLIAIYPPAFSGGRLTK